MALTYEQKSSVRRHLDYPVAGLLKVSATGGSLASPFVGYRFFQAYGRLEFKMNNLNPDEEARLVGLAYGSVALIGPNPTPGDQISVTLSGGGIATAQTITATCPNFGQGQDGLAAFANALAAAAIANPVLQAAQIVTVTPFGTGPFNQNQLPLPEVAFTSPSTFQITNPQGTGVIVPQITSSGKLLNPSAQVDGTNTVYGYLNILDALEGAWAGASQNLDTQKAGPWQGRSNEIGQRLSLYKNWQIRLSRFLEIPLWEGRETGSRPTSYAGTSRFM